MTPRFLLSTVTSITTLIAAYMLVVPAVDILFNEQIDWSGFQVVNPVIGLISGAITFGTGLLGRIMDQKSGKEPSPISNMGILIGLIVFAAIGISALQ